MPSTTRLLEVPRATPTGRPTAAATDAAPLTIVNGSRTDTGTGPAVRATRSVTHPIAAASTKESHVGPSPTHTSRYPSRSASTPTRNGSSTGLSSSRAAATTLMSIYVTVIAVRAGARGPTAGRLGATRVQAINESCDLRASPTDLAAHYWLRGGQT